MKAPVSNQRGKHGDGEIRDCKNIAEGEGQLFFRSASMDG
jgi:hypothetical protein